MFNWLLALLPSRAVEERVHNLDFASLLDRLGALEEAAQDIDARVRALEDVVAAGAVTIYNNQQSPESCNCICHSGKFELNLHRCGCKELE